VLVALERKLEDRYQSKHSEESEEEKSAGIEDPYDDYINYKDLYNKKEEEINKPRMSVYREPTPVINYDEFLEHQETDESPRYNHKDFNKKSTEEVRRFQTLKPHESNHHEKLESDDDGNINIFQEKEE